MSTSSISFLKAVAVVAKQQNNSVATAVGYNEPSVASSSKEKNKTTSGKPSHLITRFIKFLPMS
jgi:hypothetical protein